MRCLYILLIRTVCHFRNISKWLWRLIRLVFWKKRYLHFWQNHVVPRIMPEPDGSSSSEELIQQYFGKAQSDKVIPLTGFEIKVFMQDAEEAENDHYRISWKNSTSNRIDTTRLKAEIPDVYTHFCKPTQSRRFLVKAV